MWRAGAPQAMQTDAIACNWQQRCVATHCSIVCKGGTPRVSEQVTVDLARTGDKKEPMTRDAEPEE